MSTATPLTFEEAVRTVRSHDGQTLAELSADHPVLIVFLRHSGCAFCREALSDLQKQRQQIGGRGSWKAVAATVGNEEAGKFFKPYGLGGVPRFTAPQRQLYQAF